MTWLSMQVESGEIGRLGQVMAYCGLTGEFVEQPNGDAVVTLREADAVRAILLLLERGVQLGLVEAARRDPKMPRPHPRLPH